MNSIELRDYLAGKALQGLLSNHPSLEIEHIVVTAYNIADKMICRKNEHESLNVIMNPKQIEKNY